MIGGLVQQVLNIVNAVVSPVALLLDNVLFALLSHL